MSDATALQDQALAAAADVLACMTDAVPIELHAIVRTALVIVWIEGWQAGGNEATAVVRALVESLK